MRTGALALVLLAAACRKPEPKASTELADAALVPGDAAPSAGAAPNAGAEHDAGVEPDAALATAPRALPSTTPLLAALKGNDAKGFIAMTNGAGHVIADVRDEIPPDQPVLVASFTKLWTAIAVLRAVARHEFSLDDEVRTLLPDVKSKAWADSTVRELMTHTSRVPEFEDGYFSKSDVDLANPLPVLLKHIGAGTEKRGVWKYRNSEFALLGTILQTKAGHPAADVLAGDVLAPSGMTHAGLLVGKAPPGHDLAPMGHVRPQNFFTAGAGYASANDILAFFDALGAGKLLDADSEALLFSGSEHDHAAMGCWAFPFPEPEGGTTLLVERPGSFGNVRLFTAFFPAERRAIVFWSGTAPDVGRPRTKGTLAATLARLGLE